MKKIKVSEATPLQLDYLVSQCQLMSIGMYIDGDKITGIFDARSNTPYHPTTNWEQGGSIAEKKGIAFVNNGLPHTIDYWTCIIHESKTVSKGYSMLIAAMRCYVISKMGEEVEVMDML